MIQYLSLNRIWSIYEDYMSSAGRLTKSICFAQKRNRFRVGDDTLSRIFDSSPIRYTLLIPSSYGELQVPGSMVASDFYDIEQLILTNIS